MLQRVSYPELCGMGGTAVSEAMNVWNQHRMVGYASATMTISCAELVKHGQEYVKNALYEAAQQGRRATGLQDVEFQGRLPQLVETAITTLYETNPLATHMIRGSELEFPEWGNARLDVLSTTPEGELAVDDYKCKFSTFDEAWIDKEFEKHFASEQRLHYAAMTGARLFGIILVMIQPHAKRKPSTPRIIRRVSRVTDAELAQWRRDVVLDHLEMETVLQQPSPLMVRTKAAPHANQYGDCQYKEACLEANLDPQLMALRYVTVTRRESMTIEGGI